MGAFIAVTTAEELSTTVGRSGAEYYDGCLGKVPVSTGLLINLTFLLHTFKSFVVNATFSNRNW
jgi:hypothetical protein